MLKFYAIYKREDKSGAYAILFAEDIEEARLMASSLYEFPLVHVVSGDWILSDNMIDGLECLGTSKIEDLL